MHRQIAGKLTSPVTKWVVLAFWIIAFVAAGMGAGKLSSVQNNQASSWLPQSAEATKALNKISDAKFQDQSQIPTNVVYYRPSGLTASDIAAITGQTAKIQNLPHTVVPLNAQAAQAAAKKMANAGGNVSIPCPSLNSLALMSKQIMLSQDCKVAVSTVTFDFGKDGWNKIPDSAKQIKAIAQIPGVTVHLAGPGGQANDAASSFKGLDGSLMGITLIVVILILLVTYRSPILWILPIISAVIALVSSMGMIYLLAKYAGLTVNGQSQAILTILVLGASTDYALLLVARYREELRNHEDRHEAMAFALHRAAPAIIASAITVIIGMLCLTLAEMNSTAGLGPVCAIGIGVGLLSMVTLLPALLVIFGRWVFWPARPHLGSPEPTATGLWSKVGALIKPRPRAVWIGTAVVLAAAACGLVALNATGLNGADQYTKKFDSTLGQELITAHPVGDNSTPIQVVSSPAQAGAVVSAMNGLKGIGSVTSYPPKNGVALISAPMTVDATSQAGFDTVKEVRAAVHAVPGANALVTGQSAIVYDMQQASARDTKVIIPVVLVLVMLILMVLLRAVLAPFLLILTVILSFAASLGIGALVFKYGFGFAGEDSSFPLFVFVFLVALGIDYNIFLMTRVREETATRGTREGSLVALSATGGVITSAGLVLAATFAVLSTMPLVFLVEMAFTVALGVLIDTMIVRSILVTALNLDLGSKIWWPSKLDRGAHAVAETPEGDLAPIG